MLVEGHSPLLISGVSTSSLVDSDKVKEPENDEKETQKDTIDGNIKAKKVVKSVV